jgi:Cytochrome c7 and related cytochrome c
VVRVGSYNLTKNRLFFLTSFVGVVLILGFQFSRSVTAEPQKRPQRSRTQEPKAPPQPKVDYTKFSHTTHVMNQKLACSSCHKVPAKNWNVMRKGDAAFQDVSDFPEHSSCLTCHKTQFFARERPAPSICSNCHIAVTPKDTARWLFPSLGDLTDPKLKRRDFVSEFAVGFPHDKHIDVVGMNSIPFRGGLPAAASGSSPTLNDISARLVTASFQEKKPAPPKSCPVCHETYQPQGKSSEEYVVKPPKDIGDNFWLKKGTFKTIPTSHTICFTCHSADSGIAPEPKSCEVCHKLTSPMQLKTDFDSTLAAKMGADSVMLARWSRRISAGGFRHEGGEHPDLSCLNCHKVDNAAFSTVDLKTIKVPVKSCGGADGCHLTTTVDEGGALNFEIDSKRKDPNFVCSKCHVAFGKGPMPESHPLAIPTPKPKKTS